MLENNQKETKNKLYAVWKSITQRINNVKCKDFKDYGGRGITICDEWKLFINFYNWAIENGYEIGLKIDRINNNSGYNKDNCRWTTQFIQSRNTRLLKSTNTSGYRGVCHRKDTLKYRADIRVNKKRIGLGCFDTAIEAAKAYDNYVILNNLEHTRNFS